MSSFLGVQSSNAILFLGICNNILDVSKPQTELVVVERKGNMRQAKVMGNLR